MADVTTLGLAFIYARYHIHIIHYSLGYQRLWLFEKETDTLIRVFFVTTVQTLVRPLYCRMSTEWPNYFLRFELLHAK